MNPISIFDNVKESFCSLWTYKHRGPTLEIITPFSTTQSKFISVFVTKRENKFVVTDGGWLFKGEYDNELDLDDPVFFKIFSHYELHYEIESLKHNDGIFYYKATNEAGLIPNLVYDLSHFLLAIISTSQIQFQDEKERREKENFRKNADSYLTTILSKEKIRFRSELGEEYKNVRFNAIVQRGPKVDLVKYVTGSSFNYFLNSLTKATVDFEIANRSPYNEFVNNRIAIVNDVAEGYVADKIYRYMQALEEHTKTPSVMWSKKDQLASLVY
ncbi:hypothetical protein ACWKWU_02535 [Chitinophaga lutea]